MRTIIILLATLAVLFGLDYYAWQAIRTLLRSSSSATKTVVTLAYWAIAVLAYITPLAIVLISTKSIGSFRAFLITGIFGIYLSKLFIVIILFGEDITRAIVYAWAKYFTGGTQSNGSAQDVELVSRSAFVSRIALILGGVPLVTMSYGVVAGAHAYKVRRENLPFTNLPQSLEGLRIVHISDIHSGSFFNKEAVKRGVQMIMDLEPDLILFTGDLVNNRAEEFYGYQAIFGRLTARFGVYSTLGNHDYGLYAKWENEEERKANVELLLKLQNEIGWKVLMNEHVIVGEPNDSLAIIGVENWSARGNFPKYGDLQKAYMGTENAKVKILMSHDPSHWDAEVRPKFPDIDLTLSGHTHGMQFGIENKVIKWSPVQYVYEQWAGLYTKGNNLLYVNRGFGYIGYPGRVGIPPEITLFTLQKA